MIRELTSENFHGALEAEYAVIDCYGDFCYACDLLEPEFDALASSMPGIEFYRINTTCNMDIAEELGVFDLPTVLYYHKGELVTTSCGSMDREMLKMFMSRLLYGAEESFAFGCDDLTKVDLIGEQ